MFEKLRNKFVRSCYKCVNEDLLWGSTTCKKCLNVKSQFVFNGYKSKRHIKFIRGIIAIVVIIVFMLIVGNIESLIDVYFVK